MGAYEFESYFSGVDDTVGDTAPRAARLYDATPNPFNPMTTISYDLSEPTKVSLRIYDVSGRLIQTLVNGAVVGAGRREAIWRGCDGSGRQVAAGVYFYRLDAGEFSETKRMTLIK